MGKNIDPEEGTSDSPLVGLRNRPHAPWKTTIVQWIVRNRKMMRLFLIGMLCGVIVTTAFTYIFAIPANNYHWQTEIWERGGAAWTFDMKSGHSGWKWLIEPKAATQPQRPVIAPASETNARSEQL